MDLEALESVCVGIISDTHGSIDSRILALTTRCDVIVHAGDILDPDVLRRVEPRTGHVIAVRGNNDTVDQWPDGTEHLLQTLPEQAVLKLPGGILSVEHGHRVLPAARRHEKLRARHPDARAIVYGHTHRVSIDQDEDTWVLNPGAAGRIRAHGGPACLLLRATPKEWSVSRAQFGPRDGGSSP